MLFISQENFTFEIMPIHMHWGISRKLLYGLVYCMCKMYIHCSAVYTRQNKMEKTAIVIISFEMANCSSKFVFIFLDNFILKTMIFMQKFSRCQFNIQCSAPSSSTATMILAVEYSIVSFFNQAYKTENFNKSFLHLTMIHMSLP